MSLLQATATAVRWLELKLVANPLVTGTAPNTPQSEAKKPMAFNPANAKEFTPSNYDLGSGTNESVNQIDSGFGYDAYSMGQVANALQAPPQFNPYAQDPVLASGGYYPHAGPYMSHAQPVGAHPVSTALQ